MSLSEKLAKKRPYNITIDEADCMAAEARALEERVAELEADNRYLEKEVRREHLAGYEECGQEKDAANARVAELEKLICNAVDDHTVGPCVLDVLHETTVRVAELEGRLRADLAMMDEKDVATAAATARAEAAEAEVARLRGDVRAEEYRAQILANDFNRARDERDALRAKMEKVRAECDEECARVPPEAALVMARAILAIIDGEGDT